MKNIKLQIAEILKEQVPALETEVLAAAIEVPADSSMGDYAFPCFRLAKELHKAPQMIAADIAAAIAGNPIFEKVENVNAYVNMFISKEQFAGAALAEVLEKGENFGRSDLGGGQTMIVEYSSPNIAKPFHIGHIRSTVIGNSLYKIYDFLGYNVVRINHLGDYGTQFGKMIVAYRHWGNADEVKAAPIKSLLGYYTRFHQEAEAHPELADEARATFARLEHGEKEETELWQWFRDESLKEFSRVYGMLGIEFDSYAGESFYSDKMPAIIATLEEKGLLQESRGAQIVDLSPYKMEPALIKKSDGSSLYITRDLAAAKYRKDTYDFCKCLYVVASQQNLHFQQMFKVLELMGCDWAKDCVHIPFGLVSMEENGEQMTLSTREGHVVFLEDVLNRAIEKTREIILEKGVNTDSADETAKTVGIGAVMFNELSNSKIKDYVFSWDKVLNFDGETGPYVQYTHARAASVLRNAEVTEEELRKPSAMDSANIASLCGESGYKLLKLIYCFPETVAEAGTKYEPSVVTRHVVDVAQAFNKFYHDEHIIVEDPAEKTAKLMLTYAAKQTIKNGLALLGIKAPDRM